MKKIEIKDAIGKPLLHDITQITSDFKGARFKRGHIITADDIKILLDMGKKYLYIKEDVDNLVHEEDAAYRLSQIAKCDNTYFSDVSEGKIVQFANIDGFFTIDISLLNDLNSINDITICTQRNHMPVSKGERLASMRIIPLFTDEKNLSQAENISKNRKLFCLHRYNYKKAGVIITGSEIYNGRIKDKFEPVIRKKLSKFPCEICGIEICDDDILMIIDAARRHLDKGADLLIFTGGMSVDADDVTVQAAKMLGFDILSYGVPSQPGNMTLIAYNKNISAIGVPSAAISRPVTVLDVILPSLFADIKITRQDIVSLANGGLCSLCDKTAEGCHFPNCHFGIY